MTKKVAVVVTDLVEDVEFTDPVEAIKNAGHDVTTIGFEVGTKKVSMVLKLTSISLLLM